jgi:acyl carrier protein
MCEQTVALERLRTLFLRHLHLEVPSADTDLLETGLLDSLQLVDLLLLIEEEFGRRISLEAIELDDLRSLARLAKLVSTLAEPASIARAVPICEAAQSAQPEPLRDGALAAPRELNCRG